MLRLVSVVGCPLSVVVSLKVIVLAGMTVVSVLVIKAVDIKVCVKSLVTAGGVETIVTK